MVERTTSTLKLSKNERLVLSALRRAKQPIGAYELLSRLRSEGVSAPPTVYRALQGLTEAGYVHRLASLNAFVACRGEHEEAIAAFAICDDCGKATEFSGRGLSKHLRAQADTLHFAIEGVTLELRGCCASCSTRGSTL